MGEGEASDLPPLSRSASRKSHSRNSHPSIASAASAAAILLPDLPAMSTTTNPNVPQPGPARLGPKSSLPEWLEQAKLCKYLPESVMKELCEIVKECLMEGKAPQIPLLQIYADN